MTTLVQGYEGLVCDLDGVVYVGPTAVPHAVEALSAVDVPVVYATNNASRTPHEVAEHLTRLGIPCRPEQVVTSSEAAAWLLAADLAEGERVLAVGGAGVAAALEQRGFVPVLPKDASDGPVPAAVVQGYGSQVCHADLAEAAYAIEAGARWIATNTDGTLPTERGIAPGNGTLVAAVARATGRDPDAVAGKPGPPLYLLAAERLGVDAARLLGVGDRLDTDVEGGVRAGTDVLLVLTGVDDVDAALDAPEGRRPSMVAPDLRWLHHDPDSGDPSVHAVAEAVHGLYRALDASAEDVDTRRESARTMIARMRDE